MGIKPHQYLTITAGRAEVPLQGVLNLRGHYHLYHTHSKNTVPTAATLCTPASVVQMSVGICASIWFTAYAWTTHMVSMHTRCNKTIIS